MPPESTDELPSPPAAPREATTLGVALLAAAILLGWFALDGNFGINFADEGFLWYGTLALRRGEVPMRDFQSYDAGRYIWTALWSLAFGPSLVALRLACTIFAGIGVTAGLLVARRLCVRWSFLFLVALSLCAWMQPRYKCFEQSIALMSVYAAVRLLEKPTTRQHFAVGVFGGLMALMGRNHGFYHLLTFAPLIVYLGWRKGWRENARSLGAWIGGLAAGYAPQLAMLLRVPGEADAFLSYLRGIAVKGTNLHTSVPWPWRMPAGFHNWQWTGALVDGCLYIAFPIVAVLAAGRLWRGRENASRPVLLAALAVLVPYAHFVFSRPDTVHLGHGAPVLLLCVLALVLAADGPRARMGTAFAGLLFAASLLGNFFETGLATRVFTPRDKLVALKIGSGKMLVRSEDAALIANARELTEGLAKSDEAVFFGPHFPGLYALTGRRSPTRQIYFIFPASPEEETDEIAQLETAGVRWAMLRDYALDGDDGLRFRNTNPRLFTHFQTVFEPVQLDSRPSDVVVLRRSAARRP